MNERRTTKQIIGDHTGGERRSRLYDPKALERLSHDFGQWKGKVLGDQDESSLQVVPRSLLGSDIPRQMVYTPLSSTSLDSTEEIGLPGEPPFTRGIHATMYRGKAFTMRQLSGAGSCEYVNGRIRMLLDNGATGVNLILDLPTIQMFDSDEPEATGQVGIVGVPIDCVQDMDTIFKDIPVDKLSVSLVTHYPRNTAILMSMYLAMAELRGIPWDVLAGSVQNDFVMETVVRSAPEYIQPRDAFRIQCDNLEYLRKNVPRWNAITFNGYNLREFGTSGITEMAVALANAIATLNEMEKRGYSAEWAAERLAFFWCFGNDFFEEAARLRAVRRLWYHIMRYRFQSTNPRAMWMRCHVQTSGLSLTREEPMNNIVRAGYQALAAVLGGTQSLHVDSYDEAYSVPSEEASLLSLRTQQIIEVETGVTQVADPLGGSFYVEALTDEIETRILDELDEIEKMGGIIAAVESGWLHRKVVRFIEREQRLIDERKILIVGRNQYRNSQSVVPDIWTHEHDETLEREMCTKVKLFRQGREAQKLRDCLGRVKQACEQGANVMGPCIEAARAGATEGEMRRAFVEALGSWIPSNCT